MAAFEKTFRRSSVTKMLIAELLRTTHDLPKGEEQYEAQTYLSPAGRTIAKVMIAGTATEKELLGEDNNLWRLRMSDPSGSIAVMAGQYQPDAAQIIAQMEVPCFVTVVGKLNVYEPEPGRHVVSIRPDTVTIVDGKTRDDFILDASIATAKAIRKTSTDPELMKQVTEVYGESGDSPEAYLLMAQQAVESLLPTFSAEKLDQNVPSVSPPDQAAEEAVTKTDDKVGEAAQEKQGVTTPAPPIIQAPAKAPPSLSAEKPIQKRTGASAYPGKGRPTSEPSKTKDIRNDILTVQEVICSILQEKGTIVYEDLPELLRTKGVNPNMVDWTSAVIRLMQEGYCCEPRLGTLRIVR